MHHSDAYIGTGPTDRVRAYLDARAKGQGLDPEYIHAYSTGGVVYELVVSDLREILDDLATLQMEV